MSLISDVYDALQARITAVLGSHLTLENPYALTECTDQVLTQGVGIAMGPGTNTNRFVGCSQMSIMRQFHVIITREVTATKFNTTYRASAEKTLFEDQKAILDDIESDPTLASSAVTQSIYVSDNGIEFVNSNKHNFMKLDSLIEIEYIQDI